MNCGVLSHEYSEEFDCLRKNRVEVAFYKYGAARDNFRSGRVDALATAEPNKGSICSLRCDW